MTKTLIHKLANGCKVRPYFFYLLNFYIKKKKELQQKQINLPNHIER